MYNQHRLIEFSACKTATKATYHIDAQGDESATHRGCSSCNASLNVFLIAFFVGFYHCTLHLALTHASYPKSCQCSQCLSLHEHQRFAYTSVNLRMMPTYKSGKFILQFSQVFYWNAASCPSLRLGAAFEGRPFLRGCLDQVP